MLRFFSVVSVALLAASSAIGVALPARLADVVPPTCASSTSVSPSSSVSSASPSPSSSPIAVAAAANHVNIGGYATYYYQNGVAGACGTVHSDSDFICAMDQARYGNAGNASPLCRQQVRITNAQNGKTVTVTIADDCPTCDNGNSIDLSVAAFQAIADLETGIVPISWSYV